MDVFGYLNSKQVDTLAYSATVGLEGAVQNLRGDGSKASDVGFVGTLRTLHGESKAFLRRSDEPNKMLTLSNEVGWTYREAAGVARLGDYYLLAFSAHKLNAEYLLNSPIAVQVLK